MKLSNAEDLQTEYIMPKLSKRLKPCPACGSAAQVLYLPRWHGENNDAGGFMADCMECSLCTRPMPYARHIIEDWNRRYDYLK